MTATTNTFTRQNRTILGDLTTTFSPSPTCLIPAVWGTGKSAAWLGQSCTDNNYGHIADNANCWPPTGATPHWPTGNQLNGWGFYSPGLACPTGYESACTDSGDAATWSMQFPRWPNETAIGCCPTGYTCTFIHATYASATDSSKYQTCKKEATATTTVAVATCNSESNFITWIQTLPTPASITTSTDTMGLLTTMTVTVQTLSIYAPMIQINWQQSDLASRTTTASSHSSSAAITTSSSAAGLSAGAIVGIVIGVLVIILGMAVGWIWRRRRNKRLDSMRTRQSGEELKPLAHPAQHLTPHAAVELQGSLPKTGELNSLSEPRELS